MKTFKIKKLEWFDLKEPEPEYGLVSYVTGRCDEICEENGFFRVYMESINTSKNYFGPFPDLKTAKEAAQAEWEKHLKQFLEEVHPSF